MPSKSHQSGPRSRMPGRIIEVHHRLALDCPIPWCAAWSDQARSCLSVPAFDDVNVGRPAVVEIIQVLTALVCDLLRVADWLLEEKSVRTLVGDCGAKQLVLTLIQDCVWVFHPAGADRMN